MRDGVPAPADRLAGVNGPTPALYINLDKDQARRQLIGAELGRAGIVATRVPAVDGLDLPPDLACYFAHTNGQRAPLIPAGAIGCYASHLKVYKQIAREQAPATLVLEDDAVLDDDLAKILQETLVELPAGWDMVHLSRAPNHAVRPLAALPCGRTLVRYSRIPFGTAGYLISQAGARKMLNPAIPRFWAIDTDTRRAWVFGLDVYGVLAPPIRENRAIPSTIREKSGSRHPSPRRGLPRPTAYSWTNTPLRTLLAFIFNVRKLGPAWWLRCFAINCVLKLRAALVPLARRAATRLRHSRA